MSKLNESKKSYVKEGYYEQFLADCYGIDPSTGNPLDPSKQSVGSRKFHGSLDLFETSLRLEDCADFLAKSLLPTLKDGKSSKTSVKNVVKVVEKTLVPFMTAASSVSRDAAKVVSPISQGGYAHGRLEVKRKRAMEAVNPKQPTNLVMVNEYVKNMGSPPSTSTASNAASSSARKRNLKRKALPKSVPDPPMPVNGAEYGVGEFLQIVTSPPYFKNSWRRGLMIKKIMSPQFGYVKRGKTAVYDTIKAFEHPTNPKTYRFNEPWNNVGRKPFLTMAEVDECVASIKTTPSEKKMNDQIKVMLLKNMIKNGALPATNMKFNPTTIANYKALFAAKGGISLILESLAKCDNRWIQERSIIGSMALIVVVSMTHFYPVAEWDRVYNEYYSKLDAKNRLLHDMVSDFHGGIPVRCRSTHLWFNQDDSKEFICVGLQPNKSKEHGLVAQSALQSKHVDSINHHENSNKKNGMRVTRHLMINGRGDSGPVVFIFGGLSEYEMPHDKMIVWAVEGLGIGGFGAGRSEAKGYVIWQQGYKGAEKDQFRWIRENPFVQFVSWSRMEYDGFDDTSGAPMGEELTAVSGSTATTRRSTPSSLRKALNSTPTRTSS